MSNFEKGSPVYICNQDGDILEDGKIKYAYNDPDPKVWVGHIDFAPFFLKSNVFDFNSVPLYVFIGITLGYDYVRFVYPKTNKIVNTTTKQIFKKGDIVAVTKESGYIYKIRTVDDVIGDCVYVDGEPFKPFKFKHIDMSDCPVYAYTGVNRAGFDEPLFHMIHKISPEDIESYEISQKSKERLIREFYERRAFTP